MGIDVFLVILRSRIFSFIKFFAKKIDFQVKFSRFDKGCKKRVRAIPYGELERVETWKYPQKNRKGTDFWMNVLATIGQLRTEKSLERKNWLQPSF